MTRGTTPTLIFNFCGCCIDISSAQKIQVTFSQSGEVLFVREIDLLKEVDNNKIILTLTQDETLLMKAKEYVQYQVRLLINGQSFATPIYKTIVLEVLDGKVITDSSSDSIDSEALNEWV